MRKKKENEFSNKATKSSAPDWQKDAYKRQLTHSFCLPYQFLLICKLMDVTPAEVLTDFMDILSCSSWKREQQDDARKKLIDYFTERRYGQQYYSTSDIHTIFQEMNAIGMLFPRDADQQFIEQHVRWRENYHHYWFNKWFSKYNRKP